jgi:hypothetical protein
MVKVILILIVIAILMEDSASIRKTEEEKKEEEEIAKAVNATLEAEEAKKKKEEEDEAKRKKKEEKTEKRKEDEGERTDVKGKDEACPPSNSSCPVVGPCPDVQDCPPKECGPCAPCGPCPKEKVCPTVVCGPCPVDNTTKIHQECPSLPSCTESSMTVPVAMLVGAAATVLFTGVATVVGLVIRYVPPTVSGFLFLSTIIIVWYLSSQYPAVARDLGGRAATLLREAAVALGHRLMAAIQRHQEQVSVPIKLDLFLLSEFHVI